MSISLERYSAIRNRLFELNNLLEHKTFGVIVTPAMLMDMDELRNRAQFYSHDSIPDDNYFIDYQNREMTVVNIYNMLQYVVNTTDIGFRDSNTAVPMIYESIQEYLQLWVEIITNAAEFRSPPMEELRALESVAFFIFPTYRDIRKYKQAKEFYQSKEDANAMSKSLMNLVQLFGISSISNGGDSDIYFISHLDHLLTGDKALYGTPEVLVSADNMASMTDTLFATEQPSELPSWNYNKG